MPTSFSAISFDVHRNLHQAGFAVSRGHVQQLLAALLGYKSLAAMQSSLEETPGIAGAKYVIADLPNLSARLISLGYNSQGVTSQHILSALREVSRDWLTVFDSFEYFVADVVIPTAESDIVNRNGDVIGQMAMTNADGGLAYIEYEEGGSLQDGTLENWELDLVGTVDMDQDPEKPYCGDQVKFKGVVSYRRAGRVCLTDKIEYYLDADIVDRFETA